jgi:hypothetical protein
VRRGEIFWSQCRCGRAQPSNKSHQQGVDRMMSIWDQVVQSCPSREHNQPERGCRLVEGDGNCRVYFFGQVSLTVLYCLRNVFGGT